MLDYVSHSFHKLCDQVPLQSLQASCAEHPFCCIFEHVSAVCILAPRQAQTSSVMARIEFLAGPIFSQLLQDLHSTQLGRWNRQLERKARQLRQGDWESNREQHC
jgi:hypothetical protein